MSVRFVLSKEMVFKMEHRSIRWSFVARNAVYINWNTIQKRIISGQKYYQQQSEIHEIDKLRRSHNIQIFFGYPNSLIQFKILVPELCFFLILAHSVYKMRKMQESNTLELWNKLHFEEE